MPTSFLHSPGELKIVQADAVEKGDIIANIGVVDKVTRYGAFVVCAVRGTVWSLATGTGDVHTLDQVWHEAEQVVLDVVR